MNLADDDFLAITSDSELSDFDHNFKVIAGPGAGKTYWLIKNIRNILRKSPRITSTSRIACITYTNVASDEIKKGLDIADDRVETSTIHSFLYKNIVKPYAFLLKKEDGGFLVNFEELDGHDEHRPVFYHLVSDWIDSLPEMRPSKFQFADKQRRDELVKCLVSLNWEIDSGKCVLKFRKNYGFPNPLMENAEDYKRQFWSKGQIHHEDVLCFAYRILTENPSLCDFLSSRFPYLLIDEFQDTHPIQAEIVRLLGASGSIIGVIGDAAQSIYKFQGASRKDFIEFKIDNLVNYKIEGNRRSTKKIIRLLNHVRRGDPVKQAQQGMDREGKDVSVIVGNDASKILSHYEELAKSFGCEGQAYVLAIRNSTVSKLRRKKTDYEGSWERLRAADPWRARFLEHVITAQEYAHEERFETAVKEALRVFKADANGNLKTPFKAGIAHSEMEKRGMAVSAIEFTVSNRDVLTNGSSLDFYEKMNDFFLHHLDIRLQEFKKGKKRDEYHSVQLSDLIGDLRLGEESKGRMRTIHKSKGTEFKSVLVFLDDPDDLKHILDPDINAEDDSCRLIYVGLSRAEDFLCVGVPELAAMDEQKLKDLGINPIRVS